MSLDRFHPAVQSWFAKNFTAPTNPQSQAWPSIFEGRHTLIAAPTGSGKTLAAFLSAISDLVQRGVAEDLKDETYVVYVSPLKALSNDIQRNLQFPLEGIQQELHSRELPNFQIRSWVRTGDTPMAERTAMIRRPPHIVVTTPESLYILLTSEGGRSMLRTTRRLIVDEIHALVDDKRGSHLALTIERLQALVGSDLQRIGLSATQRPIETVACFLVGSRGLNAEGRPQCVIVDSGHQRTLDVALELPNSPLEPVMALEVWQEIYDRLATLILEHRTTLVFVNTRRMAERVCRHLGDRLGNDQITSHHGSLARHHRFDAEQRLKQGKLRALVATASLELGIDIGSVDLVCQLGSTRSIATFLQRVGRAGHSVGATPKGRLFPLTRDELVESAALLDSIRRGELDTLSIPERALDILAQQIVAAVACEEWTEDGLFSLVRHAYPYRNLSRKDFDAVVRMLSEGFSTRMGRRGTYLHHDAVNHRLRGRRGARLAAITSGGAIPDTADYEVVLEPSGSLVGTVNEDFAIESLPGDIFQLGNASWKIQRVEPSRVRVEDARGQPPSIPFWLGEAPGRSEELSAAVSRLRKEVATRLSQVSGQEPVAVGSVESPFTATFSPRIEVPGESSFGNSPVPGDGDDDPGPGEKGIPEFDTSPAVTWLSQQTGVSTATAHQIVDYLDASQRALGVIPTQDTLVLERFFDESGGMQLVIHSPFGSRINRAWGLALRKRFCRKFNFELQAAASEEAIVLSLGHSHSFPIGEVFDYLRANSVQEVLTQALLDAPMFTVRWRWNTSRALAVLRWRSGRKVAPQLQRMNAEDLLAAVFPDQLACAENLPGEREIPDHPLVRQTVRDCLEEAMDIEGLIALLAAIEKSEKILVARDLVEPSPMAAEILTARPYAFLDDAPLEERRTQAVYSRRWLDPEKASDLGQLDVEAIKRVRAEAWPSVENADELHDALLQLGCLTEEEGRLGASLVRESGIETDAKTGSEWECFFQQLIAENRASRFVFPIKSSLRQPLWVAAERISDLRAIFPEAHLEPAIHAVAAGPQRPLDQAIVELLRGRLEGLGPLTVSELTRSLGLQEGEITQGLLRLEAEGTVLRGHFTPGTEEMEWCTRRLLARIHRYTLDRLRREIEPVSSADFIRFLLDWQRVAPDQRAEGSVSLAALLQLLEGFEAPAAAWEGEILPARLMEYDPAWLDALCLSGRWAWLRLTPPKQIQGGAGPIRSTPLTFLQRKNLPTWNKLWSIAEPNKIRHSLSAQTVCDFLERHGASFFADILEGTGLLRTQLEDGLGELVAAGLISADSYTGLRALLTPSSRRPPVSDGKRRRAVGPFDMENAGRWGRLEKRFASLEGENSAVDLAASEIVAWTLLRRYGVVFRRLLEREALLPWRELLTVYRRLEARGEIRGGRFVMGYSGEQFGLPEAIGSLRSIRRSPASGKLVSVSAADPVNLVGILTPGSRVPPVSANRILYRDGIPIAVREAGEVRFLETSDAAEQWQLRNALIRRSVPPQLRAYLGQPA